MILVRTKSTDTLTKLALLILFGSYLTGCASLDRNAASSTLEPPAGNVSKPATSVSFSAPRVVSAKDIKKVIAIDKTMPVPQLNTSEKINLSARNSSLKTVLLSLVKNTPYSLSFGADYSDLEVTLELKNSSLGKALDKVLRPHGYTFYVLDNVIEISKPRLKTVIYRFDYPTAGRTGSRSFSVTGFSGSSGGGGSGGGSGSASIASNNKFDAWKDLSGALSTMIFGKSSGAGGGGVSINVTDKSGRKLIANPIFGTILVTAEEEILNEVEEYVRIVETILKKQVLIEVKLLQVSLNDQFLLGMDIDYQPSISGARGILPSFVAPPLAIPNIQSPNNPFATQRFSPDTDAFRVGLTGNKLSFLIDTLKQNGNVEILSSPKISTLNNQQAVISVVTDDVFFQFNPGKVVVDKNGNPIITESGFTPSRFTVGIVLDVLPQIADDNSIIMQIHPSISNVVGTITSPKGDTQPKIDRKELDTIIKVASGKTIVIAGLIDKKIVKDIRGIPFLMDIPYLGAIFRKTEDKTEKKELVLLITPTILDDFKIAKIAEETQKRLTN